MKILLIDNNDSFTYNLLHLIKSVCNNNDSVEVCSSNGITEKKLADSTRIIISPGPGTPAEAKKFHKIIRSYEQQIPILGISLGNKLLQIATELLPII